MLIILFVLILLKIILSLLANKFLMRCSVHDMSIKVNNNYMKASLCKKCLHKLDVSYLIAIPFGEQLVGSEKIKTFA